MCGGVLSGAWLLRGLGSSRSRCPVAVACVRPCGPVGRWRARVVGLALCRASGPAGPSSRRPGASGLDWLFSSAARGVGRGRHRARHVARLSTVGSFESLMPIRRARRLQMRRTALLSRSPVPQIASCSHRVPRPPPTSPPLSPPPPPPPPPPSPH